MKNKNEKQLTIVICGIVLSIALIGIILFCFSDGISGNDFWWHVKVGEYICQNKTVPKSDIFSWYGVLKNIDWTAHEWLSDVIFYVIYNLFGESGIFLLSILLAVTMTVLLFGQIKEGFSRNVVISGLYLTLFAVISSLFFYGRPHMFSYFLLFFELKILYDFYNGHNAKKIFLLPLISMLWSNLHGGSSSLSYILCIIFAVVGSCNIRVGRVESTRLPKKKIVTLFIIGLCCIICILANPIGLKVLLYPYQNLSDNLSMSVISEWQPPDAKKIGDLLLYFFPIAILTIGIIFSENKVKLIDIAVMITFLVLFFRSARFIVLWYIAAAFYAFDYVPLLKIKGIKHRYEKIFISIVALLLLIPIFGGIDKIENKRRDGNLISKVMNDEAVSNVKNSNPKRIFNDYNLGEILIYNEIPVFFDSRADLYSQENIMADGISLTFLEQANITTQSVNVDVKSLVDYYKFDYILTLKERPLYSYIVSHPDLYDCIYSDGTVGYFAVRYGEANEN